MIDFISLTITFFIVVYCMAVFVNAMYILMEEEGKLLWFIPKFFIERRNQLNARIRDYTILSQHQDTGDTIRGYKRKLAFYNFIEEPIHACIGCMSSLWGTVGFWIIQGLFRPYQYDLMIIPFWVLSCVFCIYFATLFRLIVQALIPKNF